MNFVTGPAAEQRGATTIGIRPEHMAASVTEGEWAGTVSVAEHVGSDTFLYVAVPGVGDITMRAVGEFSLKPGETVYLTPDPARIHRFDREGQAISRLS